ncbi:MAG: Short-chain dehydrogenase/reductase [Bacteroidetes bacterium]|nr:Short-chain dehydrogenase/reductase [Bacteroidota bacterium]
MSIYNKTVYITGGSSGIGLSIALALAKKNNKVCLFARDAAKLNHAQSMISETGAQCYSYSVDTTNYSSLKDTINYAVRETGAPDILINCVGRARPHRFENISGEMMMDTMQANFGSAWNAIQAVLPHMKSNGGGRIVNTSSVGGFVGVFGYSDYSASKFALVGFSEALRQEMKRFNIKVQVLCPPDTDTPGFVLENRTKPEETKVISQSASLMTAEDVAAYTVRAMQGNDFMIIPGFEAKLSYWLKRYCPFILDWVLDSIVSKVQRERRNPVEAKRYRIRNLAQA